MKNSKDNHTPNKNAQNTPRLASPERLVKDIMESIESLQHICTIETQALESADTKTFMDIQAQKLEFAEKYRRCIEASIARKNEIKNTDPALKERLQKMQDDFAEMTQKNVMAIERMQRCSKRLSNTLRQATKDAVQKHRTLSYGESGTIKENRKRRITMSLSETA